MAERILLELSPSLSEDNRNRKTEASAGAGATRSLNQLNDDVLLKIFDHLNYDDKILLQRTCRRWRQLIGAQLRRLKAIRLGQFPLGGYQVTSGLSLKCREHQQTSSTSHRRQTGSLFNERLFQMPADPETRCYSVARYDYLHRALKQSYHSITMLSIGCIQISYRLLIVLANNLANLEHLELINCATKFEEANKRKRKVASNQETPSKAGGMGGRQQHDAHLPSLESFNDENENTIVQVRSSIMSNVMYNQHADEQLNVRERLIRSSLVKNCNLIREAKQNKQWSKMRHLLVKECDMMNEFTLSLILSLTSQALVHLEVEKNQYLTGEFLNFCGPQLEVLKIKHCPSIRQTFVDDLVRIRKLLGSNIQIGACHDQDLLWWWSSSSSSSSSLKLTTSGANAALFAILFSA